MLIESVIIVITVTILFLGKGLRALKTPSTGFSRLGASPGPLNFRIWWARWKWYKGGHELVKQELSKSYDSSFLVQTLQEDTLVLSPRYLSELNMLPESKLSSTAALVDSVMGNHTGVDILLQGHLTSEICRGPLTKHLPTLIPSMQGILRKIIAENLGQCTKTGQTVVAYDFLFDTIFRISSLVFVGESFHENKVWTDAVKALPVDVELTKLILLPFPELLRPIIARLIPQRNSIFRRRAAVCNLLFPDGQPKAQSEERCVLNLLIENGKDLTPKNLTARLMILTAAALHTSSMAITHAMFELCTRPEYFDPLRAEAQTVLSEHEGEWTYAAVKDLKLLDSFLKESQRLNQSTFLGFDRKVMSPFKLSDREAPLPVNTVLAISGWQLAHNPEYYQNPDDFDGYRFYKQDRAEGPKRSDYTDIEPGNISWGSGRFTCPGRWYGSAMMKLILANLILDYTMSLENGSTQRPENSKYNTEIHPNFDAKIVLKKQ